MDLKPRHFFIAILELVVILGVLDVAGLYAFDELAIIGYIVFYFIPAVVLLILGVVGLKNDASYARGLDILGITTSIGSILLSIGHFAYAYFVQ